jgi:F-type H+-transporting ATPase subunit gamma
MSSGKEIRSKIKSVQNTRKITRAMEMVAASKMRKAQERMKASSVYTRHIKAALSRLVSSQLDDAPALMRMVSKPTRIGVILVSTDKGLCGGLNTNAFRLLSNHLRQCDEKAQLVFASVLGSKGVGFLDRVGVPILTKVTHLGDKPSLDRIFAVVSPMIALFVSGQIDRVDICYSKFVNTMKQEPVVEQLLPIPSDRVEFSKVDEQERNADYLYEPSVHEVLNDLLLRYVEATVYQGVLDNLASEQSARMVAMKAASDNAKNILLSLQLTYNKLRQASITKELSEIVGGAAAV